MLLFIVLLDITPPYQFEVALSLVSTISCNIDDKNAIWIQDNCSYLDRNRYSSNFYVRIRRNHSIKFLRNQYRIPFLHDALKDEIGYRF